MKKIAAIFISILFVIGCTPLGHQQRDKETQAIVENSLVEYHTMGGFAGTDQFFSICPNGRTGGIIRGQLTKEELESLKKVFETQKFFSLKNQYLAKDIIADGIDRSIRYQEGNEVKKVFVEAGSDVPQTFSTIEHEVNEIVGRLIKEALEKATSGELFAQERGTVETWPLTTQLSLAGVVASGSWADSEKIPAEVHTFLLEKFYPLASELSSADEKDRAHFIDFYNPAFKYFLEKDMLYSIIPSTQYKHYKQGKIMILTVHQIPTRKWTFTQPLASFAVAKEEEYTAKKVPLVVQGKTYSDMKILLEKKEPYDQTVFIDGQLQEGSKLYEVSLSQKIGEKGQLPKDFCG